MAIKNSIMDIMSTAIYNSQTVEGHLDKVKDQFFGMVPLKFKQRVSSKDLLIYDMVGSLIKMMAPDHLKFWRWKSFFMK